MMRLKSSLFTDVYVWRDGSNPPLAINKKESNWIPFLFESMHIF